MSMDSQKESPQLHQSSPSAEALPYTDPDKQMTSSMITSTQLVETVSINVEDFADLLTCPTCLYTYDAEDHTPKLLPCSHTLCRVCLIAIAATAGARDPSSGTFRCPICREVVAVPRDGVPAFPPSFLVNQLLDLMATKHREVVPKCSSHSKELLLCESCDFVFCSQCTLEGGTLTHPINGACEHTVIPLAIAIKRMSEVARYRSSCCVRKLNESALNVNKEMEKLDLASEIAFQNINRTFQEIVNIVDARRQELLNCAKKIREEKRSVLREQLNAMEVEKSKIETDYCSGFKGQVEVRNISKQIIALKDKLESISTMVNPKENSFLLFQHNLQSIDQIQEFLGNFGAIRTSNTFPPFCIATTVGRCTAHLRSSILVTTYNYNGERQQYGGDPLAVTLVHDQSNESIDCKVTDNRDGTYGVHFVAKLTGRYSMKIEIFGRQIKDSPLEFDVSEHINPICIYGSKGGSEHHFRQPTSLAIDVDTIYILDTGNARIKKLQMQASQCINSPFRLIDHWVNGLDNKSTGIAWCKQSRTLLVTNYGSKAVKRFSEFGQLISEFGHEDMLEPTCIAVSHSTGQILVADTGNKCIFLFHSDGKLNLKIPLGVIGGACFNPTTDDIIVADFSRILVYSSTSGQFQRQLYAENKGKGHYCGVTMDNDGIILATRVDKSRSLVQVIDSESGQLKFTINSNDAKLHRPASLATTNDDHVIVVDLGNNCIKKYRYR